MDPPPSYRSFLVRIWRASPEAGGSWHGEVELIQSGEVVAVDSLEQALAIMRRAAGLPAEPSAPSDIQGE